MRVARAIRALVSRELSDHETLRRVAIARMQGALYDWVLFHSTPGAEQSLRTLLTTLAPFRGGELVLLGNQPFVCRASRDVVIERVTFGDPDVQRALAAAPSEVGEVVGRPGTDRHEATVLARLLRESALVDAEGLARSVRDTTWFALRALPAGLQTRRIELILGAQRAEVAPLRGSPIAAVQNAGTQVSAFPAAPTSSIEARTLLKSGALSTTKLPAAQVADALGVSLRSFYGFQVRLPVVVEILGVVPARIAETWSKRSVRLLPDCIDCGTTAFVPLRRTSAKSFGCWRRGGTERGFGIRS